MGTLQAEGGGAKKSQITLDRYRYHLYSIKHQQRTTKEREKMRAIPYKEALQWLIDNDDTEFLLECNGSLSVSASLIADIYRKVDAQVWEDLYKLRQKHEKT